jgi:hypothetical protein
MKEPILDAAGLLRAVEMTYRKMLLDDESIGYSELKDILCDALCNSVGADTYSAWVEQFDDGTKSLLDFAKEVTP